MCHNSGLESIYKFFRLVISRSVYLSMVVHWLLQRMEIRDCYRKQKDVEGIICIPLLAKILVN